MKTIGYLMLATVVAASVFARAQTFAAGENGMAQNGNAMVPGAMNQGGNVTSWNDSRLWGNDLSTIPYVGGGAGWSGYWNYQGATIAGSYARGLAAVIRAQGDYNLATSAAAVNWSVARHREIENDKAWVTTYFEMRDFNREHREAEIRRQRGNPADYVRLVQKAAPKPLTNRQLDAVTGQIRWPMLLTAADFAQQRAVLEKAFAARAYHGVLGAEEFLNAVRTIDEMSGILADQIASVPPQAYIESRAFLRSLAYEARMPAG
jgi:hypothetical protein